MDIERAIDCLRDCRAACCHDITLKPGNDPRTIQAFQRKGIVVQNGELVIKRNCPFLKNGDICDIHEETWRPPACEFPPGGWQCELFRTRDHLE